MSVANPSDLGVRLDVAAAEIQTAYFVNGSGENLQKAVNAGRPKRIRYTVTVVAASGTAMTALKAKVQSADDTSSNWIDVDSVNDNLVDISQIEQSLAIAADTTQVMSFVVDGSFPTLRVALEAVGGAGVSGDSVSVSARAIWS